jgi:diguanylate cyclase (GGDEF)-like protein
VTDAGAVSVLVIEDNAITRKVIRLALTEAGYQVTEAAGGEAALAKAGASAPSLILQDLRLPDLDGHELLARLRSIAGCADVPVIAITGFVDAAEAPGGFDEVLIKPVAPSRLLRAVGAVLARRTPAAEAGSHRRRVLLVDDDPMQRKALGVRLREWGYDVTVAADGVEALRLALATPPDLIVSDLVMPEMDGLALGLAIREESTLRQVPLIIVTSYHLDEVDRSVAVQTAAAAVVSRSVDSDALRQAIESALVGETVPSTRHEGTAAVHADRIVRTARREAELLAALDESHAISSALTSFFERFASSAAEGRESEQPLDDLLSSYLDAAGGSVGAVFVAEADGQLRLRSQLGYEDHARGEMAHFFGHLCRLEAVLAHGSIAELLSARLDDTESRDILTAAGVEALLLVPLTVQGVRVGILVLGSRQPASSTRHLRIAEAVRGPIAQAIALSRSLAELVAQRQAFRGIAESSTDGILVSDAEDRITYANPAAVEIFGGDVVPLVGTRAADRMPFVDVARSLSGGAIVRADQRDVPVAVTAGSFETAPGHRSSTYLIRDLSVRQTLDELAVLANRDGLTELFNRRRFEEHLSSRVGESIRYKFSGALLMLDLDGFKAINDRHGHPAGDAVLRAVADRLRDGTRATDFVARLGGDEFALELPHIHLGEANGVAEKLRDAISLPIPWLGESLRVGVSIGVAMYPHHGKGFDELVALADTALYAAKRAGKDCVVTADDLPRKVALP